MCGLIGFLTNERARGAADRRKFIEQAFIAGTVRGDDSTGMFLVPHKNTTGAAADWFKLAADGYSFVRQKEYEARMNYSAVSDLRWVIGHHRSATVGSVNIDNAHPFQEGPITLVHNGTLYTTSTLKKAMYQLKDVNVDSHVICHNLAEVEDPADVISQLDGAFTLIWHDARDDSLNVIRNDKRPLHMFFSTTEDTVLIASEAEMLHWLARRNNFGEGPIVYPKPGELLKFKAGSLVPEVTSIPFFVPRIQRGGGNWTNGSDGWPRRAGASREGGTTTRSPPWSHAVRVPEELELRLIEQDLDTETEVMFEPTKVDAVPGLVSAYVEGWATHPDSGVTMKAVMFGLSYNAVSSAVKDKEAWTCIPIGLRMDEDGTPVVVLRLKSKSWIIKAPPRGKLQLANRMGGTKPGEYIQGPRDEWLPVHEWLRLTSTGCVQCGGTLMADEWEDIAWVEGGTQPLCPGCVEDNSTLSIMRNIH